MRIFCIAVLSLFSVAFAQETIAPKILILAPNQVVFEKAIERQLKQEVSMYKEALDLVQAEQYFKSEEFAKRPENAQLMARYEVNYLKTLSHENLSSYLAEQLMANQLYRKIKGVIVKVKNKTSSADTLELAEYARDEEMDLVLNFSEVNYFSKKGELFCSMMVQFYDFRTKTMLLNKLYTGNASNAGLEKVCENGSPNCTINNALVLLFEELFPLILENDPVKRKQRELQLQRSRVLNKQYLNQAFESDFLSKVIPGNDSTIVLGTAYQVIFSPDRTCFVAFFNEPVPTENAMAFQKRKNDHNAVINSSGDDMDFLSGKLPNTYAHIVKGVLHDGKWYYEKDKVMYFDADNVNQGQDKFFCFLVKWNFFKEQSTELNPEFWDHPSNGATFMEHNWLFDRINTDLPDTKAEYKDYNRFYKLVANQLMKK